MRSNRFDVLERFASLFEAPEPSFEGFLRRRDRKRRNQRIAAGVIGIAVFVAPVMLLAGLFSSDRTQTPAATGPAVPSALGVPEVDYVIDLNSSVMTPLPEAIIRSVAKSNEGGLRPWASRFAASPDGSLLAYVGTGEGSHQIFIAGIDGTGVRQLTHDPTGATSPAWSPDGRIIAYEGYGSGDVRNLFVLDVATGESTQITDDSPPCRSCFRSPQFTPDGSSLVYTGGSDQYPVVRIVPLAGGDSTLLFDLDAGNGRRLSDAGNASLSPDGSLVTFLGCEIGNPGCPRRFVANADGTERRLVPGWVSNPAGTWSPDGSRIVCSGESGVIVVDIATGEASSVAEGLGAIWLDDHTLLVEI